MEVTVGSRHSRADVLGMTDITTAYVPAPRTEFMELARSPAGKLYRKQILKFGSFAHPNSKNESLVIDREVGEKLVRNFQNGVCDIVQIPVVDEANKHVEDPFRNIGEVVDLSLENDGVYATMDVRKNADDIGKTLLGVSAMMHMDYVDTRTGEHVGPTLLHTAITNRPYITNLRSFEPLIAASADAFGEGRPVFLTEENEMMTKEQMIAALRDEHGIDVEALVASAEPASDELVSALSEVLRDAGVVTMSREEGEDEQVTITDVAEAVIELSQEKMALAEQVAVLTAEREEAIAEAREQEIDDLVRQGRILPKQRDVMLELSVADRDRFEALLPDSPIVSLSEEGVTVHDDGAIDEGKFDEDVERLVQLANDMQTGGK